ncbi:hypothetical protein M6I34_02850 [Burkholderiaceae bacterium FT117]|uniref:F0F1 ATP synthase subunit epsilon n=1 Tax=Zeimonas sediminis TaxID=2944268 RepID=UPI002342E553|nr:hypothetical protein [Zeimonas sediminis]MCM5569437.1 hypothetical protein [Zeimonas sediminis]
MKGFELEVCDATRCERVAGVASFVGEDASGQFGIMPGREALATVLVYGLARFRVVDGPWEYLALPEATLHFANDRLRIGTRRYLRGQDYREIRAALDRDLKREEAQIAQVKGNLARLEEAIYRRLMEAGRG